MSECPKDTLHSKTDNYTKPQPRPQPRPQQNHRQIAIPLPPKKIQDKLTNANDCIMVTNVYPQYNLQLI